MLCVAKLFTKQSVGKFTKNFFESFSEAAASYVVQGSTE
jgi:hypothetical protein